MTDKPRVLRLSPFRYHPRSFVRLSLYPTKDALYVALGKTFGKQQEQVYRSTNTHAITYGVVSNGDGCLVQIAAFADMTLSDLVHELFHASIRAVEFFPHRVLLKRYASIPNHHQEEAAAYAMGRMYQQLLRRL